MEGEGMMEKSKLVVIALIGLMLVFPATEGFLAESQEVVQNIGTYGSINWSEGIVTAVGIGSPPEKYSGQLSLTLTAICWRLSRG
jgi:hypothetical protein